MKEEIRSSIKPQGLFFGVELELLHVCVLEEVLIGKVLDVYGHSLGTIYPKHDGSILNNVEGWMRIQNPNKSIVGIEWVTQPMTIESIKARKWDKLFESCIWPSRTMELGGHIHMSIDAFNLTQLYKYMSFIRTNHAYIAWIAERTFNTYCKTRQTNRSIDQVRYQQHNSDRYEILNRTKFGTLENRFFATPRNGKHLLKNVEWCHALYEFCKIAPLKFDYTKFHRWIMDNPSLYNNLLEFIKALDSAVTFNSNIEDCSTTHSYCSENDSYECCDCGQDFDIEYEGAIIDDHAYCDSCYSCCWYCEDATPISELRRVYYNGTWSHWCSHCVGEHAYRCDECEKYFHEDNTYYDSVHDLHYCPDCVPANYGTCSVCEESTELVDDEMCEHCHRQANFDNEER